MYHIKASGQTLQAFVMMAELSACIDNSPRALHCFIQINFLPGCMAFPHFPFYHIDRAALSHKQGRLPLSAVTKRFRIL